ncbi:hypothetical protein LMG28140_01499 [Paraburkholderia metrosideri]|uniref:Uncharacterized protein n=1 Tax=Paraburkholderia metrosideri TaxID=580937 RepID=A0ABM8NG39_9BURK|nr:hypothetical protein LMG28140_01499 [Paraburkholderia metrosideri]
MTRAVAALVMTGSKRRIVVDLCAGRTETARKRTRSRGKSVLPAATLARGPRFFTWLDASGRQIGETHIDWRKRLGLGDFDERLATQFEHGDEIHDDDRHAPGGVEQVGEFDEARVL